MFGLVPILALDLRGQSTSRSRATAYIDFGPLHANLQNVLFGLTLGLALLLIGIGAIQWARQLMDDDEIGRLPARGGVQRRGASGDDRDARARASTSRRSPAAR